MEYGTYITIGITKMYDFQWSMKHV